MDLDEPESPPNTSTSQLSQNMAPVYGGYAQTAVYSPAFGMPLYPELDCETFWNYLRYGQPPMYNQLQPLYVSPSSLPFTPAPVQDGQPTTAERTCIVKE